MVIYKFIIYYMELKIKMKKKEIIQIKKNKLNK